MNAPALTLSRHLYAAYPAQAGRAALWSCVGGVAHAGCLAFVAVAVYAVPRGAFEQGNLVWLIVLVPVAFVVKAQAFRACIDLGERAVMETRLALVRRVAAAPPERVRALGLAQLREAVGPDAESIASATWVLAVSVQAIALIVAATGFALVFAFEAAVVVVMLQVVTWYSFVGLAATLRRRRIIALRRDDALSRAGEMMLDGAQTLRLDRRYALSLWRGRFLPAIRRSDDAHALKETDDALEQTAHLVGNASISSAVAFMLPQYASVSGAYFVLTVLFGLNERFSYLVQARPIAQAGDLALDNVSALLSALPSAEPEAQAPGDFTTIQYQTTASADPGNPAIPPLDLTIERGKVHLLTGGTAAARRSILTRVSGFHAPSNWRVLIDGAETPSGALRPLFAAAFVESTQRMVGEGPAESTAAPWLERFGVNAAMPSHSLSTGERKRLALALALAEGRPVLLLEDALAGLDPDFRHRFVHDILPECVGAGLTVFATAHDEDAFPATDTRWRLDDAQGKTAPRTPEGGG